MTDFIVDEMVIRECDSMTDPDGDETFRSLAFLSSFIQSNHRLGVNEKIEKKYRDFQKQVRSSNRYTNPHVSRIISRILRSDRIVKVDGTPRNYQSIRAKKCDIQFVGVSLQLRGVFVTNDQPLKNNIISQGLDSEISLTNIEDANSRL